MRMSFSERPAERPGELFDGEKELEFIGRSISSHVMTMVLGVRRENNALKISLFDISNPINMSEASKPPLKTTWTPRSLEINTQY
jgi:uncharacterized secreted protein with C-terminal beta-propeller domain